MLDLIWVDNQKVMVHYCVKEGLLLAILWVDNQKEMVHYFVKEGLLLAIFCPFYCKKRVYYSLHFFLHKDYFGRLLSKIGLRNALCAQNKVRHGFPAETNSWGWHRPSSKSYAQFCTQMSEGGSFLQIEWYYCYWFHNLNEKNDHPSDILCIWLTAGTGVIPTN